jgi:SAM-dependent methyltransferase
MRPVREFPDTDGEPGGWTLVECPTCTMVFLHQRVSYETQIERFDWEESFRAESQRRDRHVPWNRRFTRLAHRFRRACGREDGDKTVAVVRRHCRQGRLCDFGCGNGRLLLRASRYYTVTGVDISAAMAASARRRLPDVEIVVGPVTEAVLPPEAFDAITMQSYLEHEPDPLPALRAAHAALRSGGVVAIKTPNYACWNRGWRGWNWCGFRFPEHCNYFVPQTLRLALELTGFEVLRGAWRDRLPTSDNMYFAARKPCDAGPRVSAAPTRIAG